MRFVHIACQMQLAEVDLGSSDSDQPMPYTKDSTVQPLSKLKTQNPEI